MLEMSKKVLSAVSFDKLLFRKELAKSIKWMKPSERTLLYLWCISSFGQQYGDIIKDTFNN